MQPCGQIVSSSAGGGSCFAGLASPIHPLYQRHVKCTSARRFGADHAVLGQDVRGRELLLRRRRLHGDPRNSLAIATLTGADGTVREVLMVQHCMIVLPGRVPICSLDSESKSHLGEEWRALGRGAEDWGRDTRRRLGRLTLAPGAGTHRIGLETDLWNEGSTPRTVHSPLHACHRSTL